MKRLVILNTASGRLGSLGTRQKLADHLHRWGRVVAPASWIDSRDQVREFLRAGGEQVVVLGGDGTLNSVVNGFWDSSGNQINSEASLTVTKLGTGCDYFRTLARTYERHDWWNWVESGHVTNVDIGRIEFLEPDYEPRYFINVGSVGFNARVARLKGQNPKWLPRQLAYVWPTLREMIRREPVRTEIKATDFEWDGELLAATLALGRFAGGGMKFGRHEFPDRGSFDVRLIPEVNAKELLRHLPKLYRGGLEAVPEVEAFYSDQVEIKTRKPMEVEFDGEVYGTTGVYFRVLKQALRVTVP
ncbi:MAG: hypothetical protein H6624_05920 [Bdellovibrionaceae bacterium]|nr:hypothetical protein [Bdellovibrionales bacterium]MCB9083859.1 hypothetical protein [Pseudobdellovibrionaceae bacterium]